MAGDPSAPDARVIAAYLDDVDLELDAARRLVVDPPNRFAAFHLQQAAEKLIKAVRLSRSLRATADHNLEIVIEEVLIWIKTIGGLSAQARATLTATSA